MIPRRALEDMTRILVDVAAGRRAADVVVRNGRWVNVYSAEIIDATSIAIVGGRIAYCGPDRPELIGPDTQVLDADGRYLVPGFLDAHVHVESSMMTVRGFAAAVLPHGTTGAFADPHEIANVLGLDGVRLMMDEARTTPLALYMQIPSCVPAAPELETSGACIGPVEVAQSLSWDGVIGLGEVMNYPGVIAGDRSLHDEIREALKSGKVVGGHYAGTDLGVPLSAYVAGGPSDCHEGTRAEDALARIRQGMYAMLREGSSAHNVSIQARALLNSGVDTRRVLLCTDDRHSETLDRQGHMDDVVRLAMAEGLSPVTAIQMASLNTAEHFGVAADVGSIGPGRFADILIVSNLERLDIDVVLAAGDVVAGKGVQQPRMEAFEYPEHVRRSVHLEATFVADDFCLQGSESSSSMRCRVIEAVPGQVTTRSSEADIPVVNGILEPPRESGIGHLAVVDRHTRSGRIGRGLVHGYGIVHPYGLASTVGHDCHNLMVMGTDRGLMAVAANRLIELQGGICLVGEEGILAEILLPVAGIMSPEPLHCVVAQANQLHDGLRALGCTMNDALMSFFFLALPVIPELRLTDRGLVDVNAFRIVPLAIDRDNR